MMIPSAPFHQATAKYPRYLRPTICDGSVSWGHLSSTNLICISSTFLWKILGTSARSRAELSSDEMSKFRQLPCRTFVSSGACPYRERCVYLHDPRLVHRGAKTLTRKKNREDIIQDSLFWPALPSHVLHHRLDSSGQPQVAQRYSVPSPQADQYSRHDRAVYSMWMHFVTYCLEVDNFNNNGIKSAEIRAHAHPDYLHSSDARFFVDITNGQLKPCENTLFFDESIPVNPYINNVRLEVFKTLSFGKSVKSSIGIIDEYSPACLVLASTVTAENPIPNLCLNCSQSHPSKKPISPGETEKCNKFCMIADTSGTIENPPFAQHLPSKIGSEQRNSKLQQYSHNDMIINNQFCSRTNSPSIDMSNNSKSDENNRHNFASIGLALQSSQKCTTPTTNDNRDLRKISHPPLLNSSAPFPATMKCFDREEENLENIEDEFFFSDLRYSTSTVSTGSLNSFVTDNSLGSFYHHSGENEKVEEERKNFIDQSLFFRSRAQSPSCVNSESSDRGEKERMEYNFNKYGSRSYNDNKLWISQNRDSYSSPNQFSSYGIASPSAVSAISGQTSIGSNNYNQKLMSRVAEYKSFMDIKRLQGQSLNPGRDFYFSKN